MSESQAPRLSRPVASAQVMTIAASRWPGFGVQELFQYSGLLLTFAVRDLHVRYRQTVIGVVWLLIQPLLLACLFSFVFGQIANMPKEHVPRVLLAYAGVLGWNLFSTIVVRGAHSLVDNAALLSKVFFPREILPISVVLPALVDFVVSWSMFQCMSVSFGVWPPLQALLLPIWVLVVCLLAVGCGLITSALMVWYRDVVYIVQLAMQLLMYASPIAFTLHSVPERYRVFVQVNPVSPLLEAFRWSLLGVGQPSVALVYPIVLAVILFAVGLMFFRYLARGFADVI
jgi:lipopolysaccharide transport system permease protein